MRRFDILALLVLAACQQNRLDGAVDGSASAGPVTSTPHPVHHDELEGSRNAPRAALDALDQRTPVPLLPMMANHQKQNMRDHLSAVQEIVAAIAVDDFSGAERAAGRMGFSEPMAQMCTHMGAGAAGFTERALEFHHTADTIAVAARAHDHAAVTAALGKTLSACTGCHATFKQEVVDEATWSELTGAASAAVHAHQ
jgi:hypothetical protein